MGCARWDARKLKWQKVKNIFSTVYLTDIGDVTLLVGKDPGASNRTLIKSITKQQQFRLRKILYRVLGWMEGWTYGGRWVHS
jgi:hypothetical protein